jgi:mRNA interferase RelE/StbE
MANYAVKISKKAEKQLDKMQDNIAAPVLQAIGSLAENPRPFGYRKLKGRDAYRIRVGNYRVIYDILDAVLVVEIIEVGNRKDVYEQ